MKHTAVSFRELLGAFEAVSFESGFGENAAYLCRETGKILYQLASDEDADELSDDIEDEDKYVPIPDKRELDLGKSLVLAFARECLPDDYQKVREMFSRRGAYARFNDLLDYRNMRQQWFEYRDKAEEEALRAWCKTNSIEVDG
jgi:hypothetical protein